MAGQKWTDAETKELRKLAPRGLGKGAVARALTDKFGRQFSYNSVDHRLRLLGLFCAPSESSVPPPAKRKLTPRTVDYEGEIAALKDRIKGQGREAKLLKRRVGELQEMREIVNASVHPMRPKPMQFKRKAAKGEHAYSAVAMVGDWHTGEVISAKQTADWGEYNLEVQDRRAKAYGERVLRWLETQRSGLHIPRLYVPVLGDMVSGNIHYEFEVTNEVPVPQAACLAGKMLSELIAGWAPHASEIVVDIVGTANHDRLTVRPQHKQGSANSWNMIVYYVASAFLRDFPHVKVLFHEDSPAELDFGGLNVLAMHGHQVRAWSGVPAYGMQRMQGRLALGYMYQGKAFKTCICGHWHQGFELPGWIVNGCLCGTSEFDRNAGRFAPPSQTSYLWHPRYGEFNLTRWNLLEA